MMKSLITVCLLVFCKNADGACTFPSDLTGSWVTSTMGTITFTTSQVTIPSVYTFGNLVFDCDTLDGTQYLLRSTTTVSVLNNQLDVVTCFNDITMLTTSIKYKLQHATTTLNDASNWRIKVLPTGTTLSASTLCDVTTPYATGSEDILIKDGSASSAYSQCPDALLGKFAYTYDAGSGDVCSSGSNLDVCTDLTAMTFNLSTCSQKVAFSSGGVVNCVYNQTDTSTSTTYVIVYNNDTTTDESSTYRYTCLAVSETGSVVNVSESAQICQGNQTSTYVATGATLQLTANQTCVPFDTTTTSTTAATTTPVAAPLTGNTAGIAVGVSFAIIMITLLVVLFLFLFCGKKRMRLYKTICGGKCFTVCTETHSCMRWSLFQCCGCLSWTKAMLMKCYDCCCPECSQGRVEPSSDDVEANIVVTITPPADEMKDSFTPLPPSVEEVGPVDAQGNPRRLPPLDPKTSPMTVIEEESEDVPSSPTKLPGISPRTDEPEPAQDGADGKMEPEERVEVMKVDEFLVAVAGEQVQGQETEGEVTTVKELSDVQVADVVQGGSEAVQSGNEQESIPTEVDAAPVPPETAPDESGATPVPPETTPDESGATPVTPETDPTQPETTPAQPETTPVEPETDPAQPETTPAQPETTPAQPEIAQSTDQPETPSETTSAQPTQQTTAARELDLEPVEHSTPRE
ncbi:cell wall adhesin EAP1-like [Haliotis rufescens]|uniref:cell wall adhesin EAP1-like n=1 Tax=Haliotis rufescens TaxID=6454 RepID=UPI00201F9B0A|nr:cell wall adhesin EAP1-like [Haliotis rufescens]